MPNIGFPELIVVLVIALLVFGPKRLPEVGRQIGRTIREFRDATSSLRSDLGIDDMVNDVNDIKSQMSVDLNAPAGAPAADAEGVPSPADVDAPSVGEQTDPGSATSPESATAAPEPVDDAPPTRPSGRGDDAGA